MNRQRRTTSTPGQRVSTMKVVIPSRPPGSSAGVRAITTSHRALVPLVHQSFSPSSTKWRPSADGSARARIRAASEPTLVSVSAKAEMVARRRTWGRNSCFCASVPNSRIGLGDPDGLVRRNERGEASAMAAEQNRRPRVDALGEPEAAVPLRDLDSEGAQRRERIEHFVGDLPGAVDFLGVHRLQQQGLEPLQEGFPSGSIPVSGYGRTIPAVNCPRKSPPAKVG